MGEEDRKAQEVLRRLMESLADATGVLSVIRDDLGEYFTLMEARYRRLGRRLLRMGMGVTAGFIVSIVLLTVGQQQTRSATIAAQSAASEAKLTAEVNRTGIRVSCVLLTRTLVAATGTGAPPPTAAGRAGRERTVIAFTILARNATAAERARLAVLTRRIVRAGGVVAAPPCEDAAKHPERYFKP